jgi:hypothetical protein
MEKRLLSRISKLENTPASVPVGTKESEMAKLTAAARKKLPSSDFADPKNRAYPMEDASHVKAAKILGAKFASPSVKAKISKKAGKPKGRGK